MASINRLANANNNYRHEMAAISSSTSTDRSDNVGENTRNTASTPPPSLAQTTTSSPDLDRIRQQATAIKRENIQSLILPDSQQTEGNIGSSDNRGESRNAATAPIATPSSNILSSFEAHAAPQHYVTTSLDESQLDDDEDGHGELIFQDKQGNNYQQAAGEFYPVHKETNADGTWKWAEEPLTPGSSPPGRTTSDYDASTHLSHDVYMAYMDNTLSNGKNRLSIEQTGMLENKIKRLNDRLHIDALNNPASQQAPPPLPDIPGDAKDEHIIDALFSGNVPGVVVGDIHDSSAPKQFLIDNMAQLRQQGVNTLYLEGFHQPYLQDDLNQFSRAGKMSPRLENFVDSIGTKWGLTGKYSEKGLLDAAQRNGIRLVGIEPLLSFDNTLKYRVIDFNYFASLAIHEDQQTSPGKFVVFCGDAHVANYQPVDSADASPQKTRWQPDGLANRIGVRSLYIDLTPGSRSVIRDGDAFDTLDLTNESGKPEYHLVEHPDLILHMPGTDKDNVTDAPLADALPNNRVG